MTTTLAETTATATMPRARRRLVSNTLLVVVLLIAAGLPGLTNSYRVSIACTALVFATLALGTQLLTGVGGLPSLGQAAYLCVGAYTAGLLGSDLHVTNGPVQLLAAVLAGAIVAAVTAPLVLRTRGTAHLMVTFAVAELVRTTASKWVGLTGGDNGLTTPYITLWPGLELRLVPYVYWYLLGCFLILAGLVALLLRSRVVLALRAAADHERRLDALGHPVTATLLVGHVVAAALAAAAGAMLVASNQFITPGNFALDTSALALLAAAIGVGTMRGAVAGAVFIIVVRDLIGAETNGHAMALLGLAFLIVAYRPALTEWLKARRVRRTR
jgi:ABC-type branched-subunit amino acid transport system permease subunit